MGFGSLVLEVKVTKMEMRNMPAIQYKESNSWTLIFNYFYEFSKLKNYGRSFDRWRKKSNTNERTALSATYHTNFHGNSKHSYPLLGKTSSKKRGLERSIVFKTRHKLNDEKSALGFHLSFNTRTGIWSKERLGQDFHTAPYIIIIHAFYDSNSLRFCNRVSMTVIHV